MLPTYKAVLKGNQLQWLGEIPEALEAEQEVIVEVTILDEPAAARAERGQKMAEALRELAAINAFSYIDDPVAWQREMRADRPLPGRDE